jgi:hypothetical protein
LDHGPVIARFELKADANLSTKGFATTNGLSVLAYRNPISESFNIVVNSVIPLNLELHIYVILVRPMGPTLKVKGSVGENMMRVNSSKLPSGGYIYSISAGNKILFKDKIVKK